MAWSRWTADPWRWWSQPPSSTRYVGFTSARCSKMNIQISHVHVDFLAVFKNVCLMLLFSSWSQSCCWVRSALLESTSESEWRVVDMSHRSTVSRTFLFNLKFLFFSTLAETVSLYNSWTFTFVLSSSYPSGHLQVPGCLLPEMWVSNVCYATCCQVFNSIMV